MLRGAAAAERDSRDSCVEHPMASKRALNHGRIARRHRIGRDVARDDRTGADESSLNDRDALEYAHIKSNTGLVGDDHLRVFNDRPILSTLAPIYVVVLALRSVEAVRIVIHDCNPPRHYYVVT